MLAGPDPRRRSCSEPRSPIAAAARGGRRAHACSPCFLLAAISRTTPATLLRRCFIPPARHLPWSEMKPPSQQQLLLLQAATLNSGRVAIAVVSPAKVVQRAASPLSPPIYLSSFSLSNSISFTLLLRSLHLSCNYYISISVSSTEQQARLASSFSVLLLSISLSLSLCPSISLFLAAISVFSVFSHKLENADLSPSLLYSSESSKAVPR